MSQCMASFRLYSSALTDQVADVGFPDAVVEEALATSPLLPFVKRLLQ